MQLDSLQKLIDLASLSFNFSIKIIELRNVFNYLSTTFRERKNIIEEEPDSDTEVELPSSPQSINYNEQNSLPTYKEAPNSNLGTLLTISRNTPLTTIVSFSILLFSLF